LIDTFLHGRDRSYSVADCLELVSASGLVFQDWFLKHSYYPQALTHPSNEFFAAINALPREMMWSVMERVNTLNACHFFMATHPERPASNYRIDFNSPQALDYVPRFRLRCGSQGQEVFRPGWSVRLDPIHVEFLQHLTGDLSIREIVGRVNQSGMLAEVDQAELESVGLELFKGLRRADFIAVNLRFAKI
jgi:hypothetical protein